MVYVLLVVIVLAASLITGSAAAFFFSLIILLIGEVFCRNTKSGRPGDARLVFNITFIVYTLLILIRIFDMAIPDPAFDSLFKTGGDEDGFFEKSQIAAMQGSFFDAVPNITNTLLMNYSAVETVLMCPGYHMYIGLIGYLAEVLFDGNAVIVQLLGSVLFSCLLSVELFKILALYVPSKRARHYAILGALCTGFVFYGTELLRDIHITFFYALMFYIILQPYSKRNLIRLFIIMLITASFRVGSALFMVLFILYYLYRKFRKNKGPVLYRKIKSNKVTLIYRKYKHNKVAILTVVAIVAGVAAFAALPVLRDSLDRILLFSTRTVERITDQENSYLLVLYKLPTPIKELAVIASTYMTPFTSWNQLEMPSNIFHITHRFMIVIYEFYWFLVVWLTTKWCVVNKKVKTMPKLMLMLLILALVYLFISTSDFTVRRTMCMYPLMYLCYVYLKEHKISRKQFKNDLYLPLAFYGLGFIVFVL